MANNIGLKVEVCGQEEITVNDENLIEYNVTQGTDIDPIVITKQEIETFFTTSAPQCNLTTFVAKSDTGPADVSKAEWYTYVTYLNTGSATFDLVIDYHKFGYTKDTSVSIFIRA